MQLFDEDGNTKEWQRLKIEFDLENRVYFSWRQLIHALPDHWK